MRKILLILFLAPLFVFGQVWQQNNMEYGHQFKGLKATRTLLLPLIQSTVAQGRDSGALRYNAIDSTIEVWTGYQWRQVGSGGSGDLSLYVPKTTTININGVEQNLSENRQYRTALSNTGVLTYSGMTIASSTTVNVGAVKGIITDNETDPENPSYVLVDFAGASGVTVPTIGTGLATVVLLDRGVVTNGVGAGSLVFQNTAPTSAQRKQMILLSKVSHADSTNLGVVVNAPDFVTSPLQQFRDLFNGIEFMNKGVEASGNLGLTISTSGGTILGEGINFVDDKELPNHETVAAQSPTSFLLVNRSGPTPSFQTAIDPTTYDLNGVTTTIGGGTNNSTIQYLRYIPDVGYIIQRGQTVYNSLSDAVAAVGKEDYIVRPTLTNGNILIAAICMRRSATNMNDPNYVRILSADKFGQLGSAASGVTTATLQTAYNNSVIPQILTNSTNGAVTIQRGSAADTDTVLAVRNGAGANTFAVKGNGVVRQQVTSSMLKGDGTGNIVAAVAGVDYSVTDSAIWKNNGSYAGDRTLTMNGYSQSFLGGKTVHDSLQLISHSVLPSFDSIYAFGNSITVGQNASPQTDSGYVYRLGTYFGKVVSNRAVGGSGIFRSATNHNQYINTGHGNMGTVMAGFNDVRRGGADRKTLNKIINGHKAIFANQFLKSYKPAGLADESIVLSGSWTAGINSASAGGKTSNGALTNTLNDSITYTFLDTTVIAAFITADGSGGVYTYSNSVQIYIDNVLVNTISLNEQTDGISDGVNNNKNMALVYIVTGLTNTTHKIKIVNNNANYLSVDYFGHLVDVSDAKPLVIFHAPKMDATGYTTAPANATDAIIDTMNVKIDSLFASLPSYPVTIVNTNNYYTATIASGDLDVDHIHPTNQGHRKIFEGALDELPISHSDGVLQYGFGRVYNTNSGVTKPLAYLSDLTTGGITFDQTLNNGNTISQDRTISANGHTLNYTGQVTSTSGSFTADSVKVTAVSGVNPVRMNNNLAPSTSYLIGIGRHPAALPYMVFVYPSGGSNSKFWDFYADGTQYHSRVTNDANSVSADWMTVTRSGVTVSSVAFSNSPVVVGSTSPNSSSQLDVTSTTKGFLPPRMTTTQRNTISSPAAGLQIFDNTVNEQSIYDGTSWTYTAKTLAGSAILDFGSTAAQSSADLTITVTGAADGDVVSLGVPNGSTLTNSSFTAWVSAANTVTVRFNNYSSGAQDPASGTFKVRVIK